MGRASVHAGSTSTLLADTVHSHTSAPQQQNSDTDDFADSTATTGLVTVDESIVGRIESSGDVDWILVQADPGQWFTITVTGYGEDDHTALETPHQRAYYLLDGSVMTSEHALIQDLAPCTAGCTHVEVSQGGSRYVAVASTFEANTGSYQLTITLERAYETAELASDVSNDVDTHGFLRILTPTGAARLRSSLEHDTRGHPTA